MKLVSLPSVILWATFVQLFLSPFADGATISSGYENRKLYLQQLKDELYKSPQQAPDSNVFLELGIAIDDYQKLGTLSKPSLVVRAKNYGSLIGLGYGCKEIFVNDFTLSQAEGGLSKIQGLIKQKGWALENRQLSPENYVLIAKKDATSLVSYGNIHDSVHTIALCTFPRQNRETECPGMNFRVWKIQNVSDIFRRDLKYYSDLLHHTNQNQIPRMDEKTISELQQLVDYLTPASKELDEQLELYRAATTACRDKIKEVQNLVQEQTRAEQAAYEQKIANRRTDSKWMSPVLSAQICKQQQLKKESLAEINREYKYAKITGGGMIDKELIYGLQTDIREADELIERLRGQADSLGIRLMTCKNKLVEKIANCVNGRPNLFTFDYQDKESKTKNPCVEAPLNEYVELINY